ncbi:MAG: GNAT family N-acetyltransferase [Planctomycetota bacterium]
MDAVTLEPLGPEHAEGTLRALSDPDVAAGLGLSREPSLARTQEWIAKAREDAAIVPFAILAAGEHVGNVVLDQLDRWIGQVRLSIYLGAAGQGRGVGTRAVQLAVAHAFERLELNRVWLQVHVENEGARRCYLKAGFREEGLLREAFRLRGRLVNARLMAVLRRDPPPE